MFNRNTTTIVLVLVLAMATTALAQESSTPLQADRAWNAAYWNNTTLSGTPALQRSESALKHDWGTGAPPNVAPDRFSARWARYIDFPAGVYRFTATSDDGIRVWVDNDLIIDEWYDHPAKTSGTMKWLDAGLHLVEVEYYENGGLATVELSWMSVSPERYRWQASYWNNTALDGVPQSQRAESAINHNWRTGSPHRSISADGFSARWVRAVDLPDGVYRFTATSDDGIRVWVDNDLIIDKWYDHPAQTYRAEKDLSAGQHWIVVEYYEKRGLARAEFSWTPISTSQLDWRGEYFANATLSGIPAVVRNDQVIDFWWAEGSPAPEVIGTDRFSARWTRTLNLPAGRYRFEMTVDDGGRLWVNNHLLIEAWKDQTATIYSADIRVPGGPVPIKMHYYEHGGLAVARLSWTRIDAPSAPETVLVDDTSSDFNKGGAPYGWRTAPEGHGGELTWAWNNDRERPNCNWARWRHRLVPGRYEVLVYIPERYSTTSNARYWVVHARGSDLRAVDQSSNGGRWLSLGTYWFDGTENEYVFLSDITYEERRSRLVAFDAVKWVPR